MTDGFVETDKLWWATHRNMNTPEKPYSHREIADVLYDLYPHIAYYAAQTSMVFNALVRAPLAARYPDFSELKPAEAHKKYGEYISIPVENLKDTEWQSKLPSLDL